MSSTNFAIFMSKYYGGLAAYPKPSSGNLIFTETAMGVGGGAPKNPAIPVSEIAAIDINGSASAKSRVGAELMLGVAALAAKNSQTDTTLTVFLRDGQQAVFEVGSHKNPAAMRGKIGSWAAAVGVPWANQAPQATPVAPQQDNAGTTVPRDAAEQLTQLAALHASGALTADEFAAAKARVIGA